MRRFPLSVRYLFRVYLIGIIFFTLFRLILVIKNWHAVQQIPAGIVFRALYMGFRFDTVISGYILALPIVFLTLLEFTGLLRKGALILVNYFLFLVYTITFFGCAADIPFFLNYNTRLNAAVLNWTDSPIFMMKMVVTEWSYLIYLLLFVLLATVFFFALRRVYKKYALELANWHRPTLFSFYKLPVSIIAMGVLFIGMRGRVAQKSPIMIGTAYFSNYDFANQLGLNPLFTFMNSWFESHKEENKHLHLLDDKKAVELATRYLNIHSLSAYNSPIARLVQSGEPANKYNVVLVLMESMSADFMAHGSNGIALTPVLDSIANKGYYFNNFYSAGIHTFNGIFSSLYGFPAIMARHTMVGATIPQYSGLPYVLKQNGYKTIYFTTHDDQFDNVGGFLKANFFDSIISEKDYPSSAVVSVLGVPDHFLFSYSIPVLNGINETGQPFFATIMTGSNHGPYTLPDSIAFKPKRMDIRGGTVEYADWSIGQFISEASKQPWFNNTIFVFAADHGVLDPVNNNTGFPDMPYALNHIPLIIYSPVLKDAPRSFRQVGGQIDIFPTICGLLHLNYVNNTMGVDLLAEQRPYIYFSADDKLAVADTEDCFIWHTDNREAIYPLSDKSKNVISTHPAEADSMRMYGFSMLQATDWLMQNGKTAPAK